MIEKKNLSTVMPYRIVWPLKNVVTTQGLLQGIRYTDNTLFLRVKVKIFFPSIRQNFIAILRNIGYLCSAEKGFYR